MLDKKALSKCVSPMRNQLRIQERRINGTGSKNVILMNASSDLAFPYPPSSKLVPVASLSEEDVTSVEKIIRDLVLFHADCLNFVEIKISPQNICNPEIRQLNRLFDQTILADGDSRT